MATRAFFQLRYPEMLMEKVESFMHRHKWQLIWTAPYMPTLQPIELFCQHGKHYVSFNFEMKRNMKAMHMEKIQQARELEMKGFEKLMGSDENMEAFMAFQERRPPDFKQFR